MQNPWFKRIGIIYLPVSLFSWVILIGSVIYAVYAFIDIDSRSHSVSDTLRPFFINLLVIFAVYTLIAWLTSSNPKAK